ncbi:signal peptidase I [candidate division KSB3 bacterium]|uniref:Signal peptidase I n=1 Tax=candidate division KSB3 bacterium TaxID=2044937 RepID=A0A2G6E4G1_9BACT|nr:MAG: signal peptidase I [candidate division KSB3 bacterium]PIE29473.1 MAG: signal peptidase I [candidate division KSB3 bacterium]
MEHSEEHTSTTIDYKAIVYDWGKTIVLAIGIALVLRLTIVGAYYVPTGSMKPTIRIGDRLLGAKFSYWFSAPSAGDIIVFEPPEDAHSDVPRFVKRVVAVGGETVEVKNGALYVNGVRRQEPYLASPPYYELMPVTVPKGHLFVLGDNRNNSRDGHVWGFLPERNVEAKILFRFWPLFRIGALK